MGTGSLDRDHRVRSRCDHRDFESWNHDDRTSWVDGKVPLQCWWCEGLESRGDR